MNVEKKQEQVRVTVRDVLTQVQEMSGIDPGKITMVMRYTWHPPMPGGKPTVFRHGKDSPIDTGYTIFGMFRSDDVIHVYLLWTATNADNSGEDSPHPPMRYFLEPQVATYGAESMPLDVWQEEFANALVETADGMTSAEREREAVVEYIHTRPTATATELADAIEAEEHLADDDDDDDNEEAAAEEAPAAEAMAATVPQ